MPSNLTGQQINDTYSQLLHVDGGPDAAEKPVYSGTGVATALNVGISSASVGNIRLAGNSIAAILGTLDLTAPVITGGSITGITDLAVADGGTGASDAATARTNLGLGTISTQAANNVAITGGSITGVAIPFANLSGRAYASFYDAGTSAQTGSTTDKTAVKWATAAVTGSGITVASNSQITLAAAGTYRFNVSLQLDNSDGSERDVDIWFAKNGTNITASNSRVSIPANNSGGTLIFAIELFETVAANDYVEVYWYPSSAGVTLTYRAAVSASVGVTPAIPSTPPAIVVVERIA